MYYTGINPFDGKEVYVATTPREKRLQRALLQFNRPGNAALVREALCEAGRPELIGYAPECLIRPALGETAPPKSPNRVTDIRYKPVDGKRAPHGRGNRPDTGKRTAPKPGSKPFGTKPYNGKPSGNKPFDSKPFVNKKTNGKPEGGRPTSGRSDGNRSANSDKKFTSYAKKPAGSFNKKKKK